MDWQLVEFCYPPIIISRSSKTGYDLRYTVESTEDNIAHKGVLLISVGMRYKSYCTSVGRTFIVDPKPVSMTYFSCVYLMAEHFVGARSAIQPVIIITGRAIIIH